MKAKDRDRITNGLRGNALKFLESAVDLLEDDPMFSVMHFAMGLELMFKVRLMHEHWSLVLDDPANASLVKFMNGEANSVSAAKAVPRLEKLLDKSLPKNATDAFEAVRKTRNRIAHFYDPDHADPKRRNEAFTSFLKAWHYLNELLEGDWLESFQPSVKEKRRVEKIVARLRNDRRFLDAKFEEIQDKLKPFAASQFGVFECPVCSFESRAIVSRNGMIGSSHCLLCGDTEDILIAECECETEVLQRFGYEYRPCIECGKTIDKTTLIDRISGRQDQRPGDPDEMNVATCAVCTAQAVVRNMEYGWVCLDCGDIASEADLCEYCHEFVTGYSDYANGCEVCDGALANSR